MQKPAFNLNTLKGRIAENIIQDLFLNSGYNIFNYGLERIHPSLSRLLVSNNGKTGRALRFMPDFVVQSSRTGDLFYMEVKFRANGIFFFDDHYTDYPYKNAWFIIVSPVKIQCMHYSLLSKGKKISPSTNYKLTGVKHFHIGADLVCEYEKYAAELYASYRK